MKSIFDFIEEMKIKHLKEDDYKCDIYVTTSENSIFVYKIEKVSYEPDIKTLVEKIKIKTY